MIVDAFAAGFVPRFTLTGGIVEAGIFRSLYKALPFDGQKIRLP